jgi:hypothetical protein
MPGNEEVLTVVGEWVKKAENAATEAKGIIVTGCELLTCKAAGF